MMFPRSPFPNKPTMPNPNLLSTEEANRLSSLEAASEPGQRSRLDLQLDAIQRSVDADSDAQINHWFTHHPPSAEQIGQYHAVREAGRQFALTLRAMCPPSADRSAAIRKARDAVMTANAAIACGGR